MTPYDKLLSSASAATSIFSRFSRSHPPPRFPADLRRAVYQDAAHRFRGRREKVGTVGELHLRVTVGRRSQASWTRAVGCKVWPMASLAMRAAASFAFPHRPLARMKILELNAVLCEDSRLA